MVRSEQEAQFLVLVFDYEEMVFAVHVVHSEQNIFDTTSFRSRNIIRSKTQIESTLNYRRRNDVHYVEPTSKQRQNNVEVITLN